MPNLVHAPSVGSDTRVIASAFLRRNVRVDVYLPGPMPEPGSLRLLLFNDGQDLPEMGFPDLLEELTDRLDPLLCVGIHAGKDRLREYGTSNSSDYAGRGDRAFLYTHFIVRELLPFLADFYHIPGFRDRAFAGFSLGGLSAFDVVWNHPGLFSVAGVFSGSFWWRSKAYDKGYREDRDRLMQARIRETGTDLRARRAAGPDSQRFFFECGTLDETADRNGNGVIDVIDDTLDVMRELRAQGVPEANLKYLEIPGGRHDPGTWAAALPEFLTWGWGASGRRR